MSSQPFIQVVNDKDEPLYGVAIEQVYRESLIHRVVYVAVIDEDGKLLLQKRGAQLLTDPGRWDISVGGHVDNDEPYEQAALREMSEEIGLKQLTINELTHFYKEATILGKVQRRFIRVYEVRVKHDLKINVDNREVSETKWFTIQEIKQLLLKNPEAVAVGLKHYMEQCHSFKSEMK